MFTITPAIAIVAFLALAGAFIISFFVNVMTISQYNEVKAELVNERKISTRQFEALKTRLDDFNDSFKQVLSTQIKFNNKAISELYKSGEDINQLRNFQNACKAFAQNLTNIMADDLGIFPERFIPTQEVSECATANVSSVSSETDIAAISKMDCGTHNAKRGQTTMKTGKAFDPIRSSITPLRSPLSIVNGLGRISSL